MGVRRATPEHSSRAFETELRELRAQILAMGARCERSVGIAVAGFLQGNADVIHTVTALDTQIDRDDVEIHSLIMRILALRAPVASDLRFLTTALRLVTDLERIGDEAVNVAERAIEDDSGAKSLVVEDFAAMANATRDMLHLALDAFIRADDVQAADVLGRDDDVDHRCAQIIDTMTGYLSEHSTDAASGLRAIRVAKYLERIADHATNVAEEVIFMVRGEDVRHGQWRGLTGE
jgi:phosphate transport system protein